ncbi:hypothetical protein BHG07_05390 [Brenneria salicis ATCC 15712 = DSM 30166]|nr:hypothetical protein BHG07_05390 [Brenneria salicis ATCC 15712 = DSM 30166]
MNKLICKPLKQVFLTDDFATICLCTDYHYIGGAVSFKYIIPLRYGDNESNNNRQPQHWTQKSHTFFSSFMDNGFADFLHNAFEMASCKWNFFWMNNER